MKSVNASSGRGVDSFVLVPDQRDFSEKIESLQMTASSRINSHTDLNRIDETRGNITEEGGDLTAMTRTLTSEHTLFTAIKQSCHALKYQKVLRNRKTQKSRIQ